MIKGLYDTFAERWYHGGTIYFYSDPHFGDEEMKYLRKNYIGDDEQIKRINSKIGKNDTIIFLGDIGDVEYIKKIRGYKVLVMGNHDTGATNYIHKCIEQKIAFNIASDELDLIDKSWGVIGGPGDYAAVCELRAKYIDKYIKHDFETKQATDDMKLIYENKHIKYTYDEIQDQWYYHYILDNHLFDEVYEGTLQIGPKLILSHEPIDYKFCINIHGHDHSNWSETKFGLNMCAEHIDYTPVPIKSIIESGLLKDIDDIHRETIDTATERKLKRKN